MWGGRRVWKSGVEVDECEEWRVQECERECVGIVEECGRV